MSVDRRQVDRIAELARLRFDDAEAERLTGELNEILAYVEALQELTRSSRSDAPPPALAEVLATRPDESGSPDSLHRGPRHMAPAWQDGFFVVPPPPGVHAE